MAVVSISRIQQRRGRKYSGTGLPQLASGELGWAIDSQELYIGNGSVAEGAPHVGNTRVLTELDVPNLKGESANLFDNLNYIYKAAGSIRTVEILENGTDYTDGIYTNVLLEWVTYGNRPTTLPTATITVANGKVVAVNIITHGYGFTYGSRLTVPSNSIGLDSNRNNQSIAFLLQVTSVTGPTVPVKYTKLRSMQARLDDRVNTADFGTLGNGITDETTNLQNAINQLFLNVPPVITLNGVSTNGDYVILASGASYSFIGASISGPGIPVNTTIVAVVPGVSITMDNQSTSSETGTQIFTIILPEMGSLASANPEFRATLEIPPGTYKIASPLYVPSYATIVGAGIDKTIIKYNRTRHIIGNTQYNSHVINTVDAFDYMIGASISGPFISNGTFVIDVIDSESLVLNNVATGNINNGEFTLVMVQPGAVIQFVNDLSRPGFPSPSENTTDINQPKFITLKNLSIEVDDYMMDGLQLDAVKNSSFENIALSSNWSTISQTSNCAISMYAVSENITTINNLFKNIIINNFGYGIYSSYDISNNRFVDGIISSCTFGVVFGEFSNPSFIGREYGPRNTEIKNIKFSNIPEQAIWIISGYNNTVDNCILENVAENDGVLPLPQIYFNKFGNVVKNITSDRWAYYSLPLRSVYVPEFSGKGKYEVQNTVSLVITESATSKKLFNLPVPMSINGSPQDTIIHEINYVYISTVGEYTRKGSMIITADIANDKIHVSDEYDFVGNEDFLQWFDLTAGFSGGNSAVSIFYTNTLQEDSGYFSFTYKSSIQ